LRHGGRQIALGHRGQVGSVVPDDLEDADFILLALDMKCVDFTRGRFQQRRQRVHALPAGDNLPALGEPGHARGGVHRIAEKVALVFDRGTVVKADADRQPRVVYLRNSRDPRLHIARGLHGGIDGGKYRHDFVAYGLDDATVLQAGRLAQFR
jgi:hypothetical protein